MDRHVQARPVTPARLLTAFAVLVLLALLACGSWRFALQSTFSVSGQRLDIETVHRAIFHDYIPISGRVVPGSSVYVDAVDGGQVTGVFVEEGAFVESGQPLVALKNTTLQLEVIGREAQLAEQINNLSVTQLAFEQNRLSHRRTLIEVDHRIDATTRRLDRLEALADAGGSTREQIEEVEAERRYQTELREAVAESQRLDAAAQQKQLDTLAVAVDSLTRNIAIARDNLANLTLRAPIRGQLTSLEANVGESKSRGQRIGKIDDVASFKVSALVDEFYLGRVREGQTAAVDIDGNAHALTVTKIYPEVRSRQFEVDLAFEGSLPDSIRRGQTLRLRLEIGANTQSLTLANGPFFDDSGGQWVYVVADDERSAARREVRLGRRTPEQVEVLDGLAEGDRVITSGYRNFGGVTQLLLEGSE
jgi:HlyD family secretion protein